MNNSPFSNPTTPVWLWQGVRLGFVSLVLAALALVAAVAYGVADPQPVGGWGGLQWEDHFSRAVAWQTVGQGAALQNGGLELNLNQGEWGGAVVELPASEFSLEVAGGQVSGPVGAAYGLVFGYEDPAHYTGIFINGNSYVEVVDGSGRQILPLQEWPNILLNYEANRIRIDVRKGQAEIRINDEVLTTVAAGAGQVGVAAQGSAPGQVVRFGWAKFWK